MDADDWWDNTFLEEMTKAIKSYPEHKLFASGRSRVFNTEIERYENQFLPDDGMTDIVNYYMVISKFLPLINSSNVIIKKELFETTGDFRPGQRRHEDHDLWLRLCIDEPVVFINKQLSFYLKAQPGSASTIYYRSEDFCVYLKTLLKVKSMITDQERAWLKIYSNKFILVIYIQNYKQYSKAEDWEVFQLAIQLVTGKSLFLLKFLKALPFKNTYAVLKFLKG